MHVIITLVTDCITTTNTCRELHCHTVTVKCCSETLHVVVVVQEKSTKCRYEAIIS